MQPGDLVRYPMYVPDKVYGIVLSAPHKKHGPTAPEWAKKDLYVDVQLFGAVRGRMGIPITSLEVIHEAR